MSIVLSEMKSFCRVYDVEFQDLLEAHEDVSSKSLEGMIDFVLTDLPCNGRTERSTDISSRDIFKSEDIRNFVKLVHRVIAPAANGYVSACRCSFLNDIRSWS